MSLLSVGVDNSGFSQHSTQELLERLYLRILTPDLAHWAAQQTIQKWTDDPELAAQDKSIFYQLGKHCDKALYLDSLEQTYELTPVLIAEGHYRDLYIEIEARNRLNIPRYHIDDGSLKQMASDLKEVHKLITWDINPKRYSNARSLNMREKCYENAIRTRLNEMKRELHIG